MSSFYSQEELKEIGFASVGENVCISKKASIYGAKMIKLGNNVRVDDFCIISGHVEIGNYVHISAYTGLFGGDVGIYISDYVSVSSKNCIYAISDDYSGEGMTNPMVPDRFRKVTAKQVVLEKHVIIGSGGCVLPGVIIGEGAAVAAMSLVNKNLEPWKIYGGVPCKQIKERKKNILDLENKLKADYPE